VIAVLEDPRFAIVFSAGSRAEVPIVGELRSPSGRGALIRVAGQIDRLIVTDDEVVIVDFKSNRQPPHDVTAVPDAYALQLAAYRLVLQAVYPKRRVRAGLLWTDGPKLMELPGEMLDARQAKLWDLPSTGS
jgi:ATP-dependent helicase/nuclease subunit A